jgi:hypothetical protein
MTELKPLLPEEITQILTDYFFKLSKDDVRSKFYQTTLDIDVTLEIKDLLYFGDFLDSKKENIKNVGIDFPLFFENKGNPNLAIVAMDPKRNDKSCKEKNCISLGSVFALNKDSGRKSNENDYWNFISPLTKDFNVYLTDVFKIFYDTADKKQKVSNKDSDFKEFKISIDGNEKNIHRHILEKEFEFLFQNSSSNENLVVALGKEAQTTICQLFGIKLSENEISIVHQNIKFIFMPHISRTVTQNIKTVGRLYEAIGELKNVRKNDGNKFKLVGKQIIDLRLELFS